MFQNADTTLAQYRMHRCFELSGTHLVLNCQDDRISVLHFLDGEQLRVCLDGEEFTAPYLASKAADHAYFVHTELPPCGFHRGLSFLYDGKSGWLTILFARHGHIPGQPRRVQRDILFASVPGADPLAQPRFTAEQVGRQVEYRYSEGFAVCHRYLSAHSFEWIITREKYYPQFMGVPHVEYCDMIRLSEELLLFSWLEADSGTQGAFVLNTVHMRSTGAFFGVGPDGKPESYTMGAFAEVLV